MAAQFGQGRMGAFPPVIKFLLFANLVVFLVMLSGLMINEQLIDRVARNLFALWRFDNEHFAPWQLLTYQFMHGGYFPNVVTGHLEFEGYGHIFFNMFALWMFGLELEYIWGSRKFAVYYILAGIGGGLLHLIVSPFFDGYSVPTIGASGAIMGLLVAFGMTFPDRPLMVFPLFFPIRAKYFVMLYAGLDLVLGFINRAGDETAHFAHLGGALGGFLLLKFGEPLFRKIEGSQYRDSYRHGPNVIDADFRDVPKTPRYEYQPTPEPQRETQGHTPTKFVVDGQPISQEQIDQILDKISKGGYHGLSEREKNILFEVSRQL